MGGKEALPGAVKPILEGSERVLERKASTGPFFFCAEGPTLADLAVYDFLESPFPGLKALGVELAAFPKVLAVAQAVAKDPYVESYLKLKSMGKPELIYFDLAGRGELTRLAFIAGGVDFTDTRHSFDAWPALKGDPESVPAKMFGSMPCIKHGDVMLAQSKATAVYAASLGIWKEGRLGDTMEESSANKATVFLLDWSACWSASRVTAHISFLRKDQLCPTLLMPLQKIRRSRLTKAKHNFSMT